MAFHSSDYSRQVQGILALDGDGMRPMPLANGRLVQAGVEAISRHTGPELFPGALSPEAAMSGLYLYFCAYDTAHSIAQDVSTPEGSFWHGILHRQEPDPDNARYWFRRVGQHSVFAALSDAVSAIIATRGQSKVLAKDKWDPFAFIDYCEEARRKPGSAEEETAMEIQLAEWQLLFDYCARPRS